MPAIPGYNQNIVNIHARYYAQNWYGNLFHYATPLAGVTLTTSGSTVQTFGIWNPAGSLFNIIPIKGRMGAVGASLAVDAPVWTFSTGLGSGIAGTSPVTAVTKVNQLCGKLGGINSQAAGQSPSGAILFSTITLSTAPTLLRYFGVSWGAPVATTAAAFGMMVDDFEGDVIVTPGTALYLSCPTAPGGALDISLSWLELPASLTPGQSG